MHAQPNVVAEYDGSNTLQASYITPGLDQNLTIKQLDFEFEGAASNVVLPGLGTGARWCAVPKPSVLRSGSAGSGGGVSAAAAHIPTRESPPSPPPGVP